MVELVVELVLVVVGRVVLVVVEVDDEVECGVDVEELLLVEVVVEVVVVEVGGPRMVSVPGTPRTVIVSGPLCASMLAGVNVKTPLAFGISDPTLSSRISPEPFPMTTPP